MQNQSFMHLKILLPFCVFSENTRVSRIVVDSDIGSLGILPNRLDFVAALVPGIIVYQTEENKEAYYAVDNGIIIKTDFDVLVSVRNAYSGSDLSSLYETIDKEFMVLNEHEQDVRTMMAKMETTFISQIAAFSNG